MDRRKFLKLFSALPLLALLPGKKEVPTPFVVHGGDNVLPKDSPIINVYNTISSGSMEWQLGDIDISVWDQHKQVWEHLGRGERLTFVSTPNRGKSTFYDLLARAIKERGL